MQPGDNATLTHRFTHEGFEARIYLTMASEEVFGGHVDIFQGEVHKCRIVLAGPVADDAGAILALELRGRDWIAAWGARQHKGDTGFTEL